MGDHSKREHREQSRQAVRPQHSRDRVPNPAESVGLRRDMKFIKGLIAPAITARGTSKSSCDVPPDCYLRDFVTDEEENSMIRVIVALALMTGFAFYASGIHSFRELDNALRGVEGKLTVVMEALQP
jgi:hypothetical protein